MNIVCISASNMKHAGERSTSLKVCNIIKKIINRNTSGDADVRIIPLTDYNLKPCIGCGECFKQDKCIEDNDFNRIYNTICRMDGLFIISAHYAPIPSKLSMLLEKIEQIAFLKRFNNETYRSPLFRKPVGIIGHGGGTEEICKYYKEPVINSIWNALSYPVEMNIVGLDDEQSRGLVLPVKSVSRESSSIFPVQEYDWIDIENRLIPLVYNVISEVKR